MTIGEQSVRAMMPNFTSGVSGASDAAPAVAAQERDPRAANSAAVPVSAAPRRRNCRRSSEAGAPERDPAGVWKVLWCMVGGPEGIAMEVIAKEPAG